MSIPRSHGALQPKSGGRRYCGHRQRVWIISITFKSNPLSCALAADIFSEAVGSGIRVTSESSIIYRAGSGAADFLVDGNPWPCVESDEVRLPAGTHVISTVLPVHPSRPRLIRLNGDLIAARYTGEWAIEFSYAAQSGALAIFNKPAKNVRVDGVHSALLFPEGLRLPGGNHRVHADF